MRTFGLKGVPPGRSLKSLKEWMLVRKEELLQLGRERDERRR